MSDLHLPRPGSWARQEALGQAGGRKGKELDSQALPTPLSSSSHLVAGQTRGSQIPDYQLSMRS